MKQPPRRKFCYCKSHGRHEFLSSCCWQEHGSAPTLFVVSFFQSSYFLERSMTWRTTYAGAARRAIAPTAAKRRGRYKAPLPRSWSHQFRSFKISASTLMAVRRGKRFAAAAVVPFTAACSSGRLGSAKNFHGNRRNGQHYPCGESG